MQLTDLSPDLILLDGRIYTMDARRTVVDAVAIKDGRFIAAGASSEIAALAGPHTQRRSLGGRAAIPGLFDSHVHMLQSGSKLADLRLDECTSPEEMAELVRQRAKVTPPGQWIVGQGWNEALFEGGRLPSRHELDAAAPDHPVDLQRFFNMDVVNTYALRLAGIDRHTPDPPSGKIEHSADGEPNGLLRASAKHAVRRLIPPPTEAQMKEALRLIQPVMHSFGITSVVEPGLIPAEIKAFQSLRRDGELSVRVAVMPVWYGLLEGEDESGLAQRAQALGVHSGLGDEWLRMAGLKVALDGGTTTRTAWMYDPYEGETTVSYYNRFDISKMPEYFRAAQEAGWDIGIHCCGDRAQDFAVDTFASLPSGDFRHHIIHGYFPTDHALGVMAERQIAIVLQPTFIYYEADQVVRDVGERRALNYKPARKYLDAGIPLTASSDDPSTVSMNPFPALYALVTRKDRLGLTLAAQEAITREEALAAYTRGGTWLTREEHLKGSIEAGKLADLVVLDRDYFTVPEEQIKDIRPVATMVDGRIAWQAEG